MNRDQFQKQFSADLKKFLDSPCGQASLNALSNLRPPYEFKEQEHLLIENRGAIRGYEMCLRNMIALTIQLPQITEVQADYGVPDAPKETK